MATRIEGNRIIVPGQITVESSPISENEVLRLQDVGLMRVCARGVSLSEPSPCDVATFDIRSTRWIIRKCIICHVSADLSDADVELRTRENGTGDVIALAGASGLYLLTGYYTWQELILGDGINPPPECSKGTYYLYLKTPSANEGTVSVVLEYTDLRFV